MAQNGYALILMFDTVTSASQVRSDHPKWKKKANS
jgi:hypothetical protein